MKRSELYALVWSTPVAKIADEVGVTGTRIAAICRQHSIPTPPRGYWAKRSVGKQPPASPLPSPEADYQIKVGAAQRQPRPSNWVAPGALLRPAGDRPTEPNPNHSTNAGSDPCIPAEEPKALRAPAKRVEPPQPPPALRVDLEMVRAAAAELHGIQAIRELLQAVTARAVHAQPHDAHQILSWVAAVRTMLEVQDPVDALIRLATESP